MRHCGGHAQRGSTLMLAFWALFLLSAVVFAWVRGIDRNIGAQAEANRGMEARALAHSGLAVALHPGVEGNSPHLHAEFSRGQSYRVTMRSEGGRLNVNFLLTGADPAKIALWKAYLALRGLSFQEREVFTDSLLDWVNPGDGLRRLNAAAPSPDSLPPHRPLQSLDELALVAGSGPLVSRPGWRDDLTVSSAGPLDLEAVSAQWLALLPDVGEQRAKRFVQIREERLRRDACKDGHPFKDMADALRCLGVGPQFAGLLGLHEPVLHVQSVGQSAKVIRQVEAIVRKVPGAHAQILWWNEK